MQDFVNSRDVDAGIDQIADQAGLRAWMEDRGLVDARVRVGAADVRRAATLRESLRALLLAHTGEDRPLEAIVDLNRAVRLARLSPRFGEDGTYRLEPEAGGIEGALGRIVAAVSEAMDAGTWERLKACRSDTCQWAFYDASRNRSGAWCRMAVCGNRMKVRAYRRRHRPERSASRTEG